MHARAIVLNDVMMQTDATRKPEAVQRRQLDGRPVWLLNTRNTSVVLCLGPHDTLLLLYWGANGQTDEPGDYVLRPHSDGMLSAADNSGDGDVAQAGPGRGEAAGAGVGGGPGAPVR